MNMLRIAFALLVAGGLLQSTIEMSPIDQADVLRLTDDSYAAALDSPLLVVKFCVSLGNSKLVVERGTA